MSVYSPEERNSNLNKAPTTYIDESRNFHSGINNSGYRPSNIHSEQMAAELGAHAHKVVYERLNEVFSHDNVCFRIMNDSQYLATMANAPKELGYAVIHKYKPIDFDNVRYRLDNIFYNDRCFLRLVIDNEATERFAEERIAKLYDGLVDKPSEKSLVDTICEIFVDANKDQTTQILEAIALLKKKDTSTNKTAENKPETPERDKQKDLKESLKTGSDWNRGPFTLTSDVKTPRPFYLNTHFVGLMAEQYIVHNHPTLGFLIVL